MDTNRLVNGGKHQLRVDCGGDEKYVTEGCSGRITEQAGSKLNDTSGIWIWIGLSASKIMASREKI